MVRLASVEFTKLKNVRPGTRLTFSDAGAVLLGKNGTGKTTLLQYLVALCAADTSAFVSDEPFDVSATFRLAAGAVGKLRIEGSPSPPIRLEGTRNITRNSPTHENIRLEYRIDLADQSIEYLIVISEGLAKISCNGQALCDPFPPGNSRYQLSDCLVRLDGLSTKASKALFNPVRSTALQLMSLEEALCRYDEGLDYFRMLTDESSSYISLEITRAKGMQTPSGFHGSVYRISSDLFNAMSFSAPSPTNIESFSAKHNNIDFLGEFVKLCGSSGATIILPIESRQVTNEGMIYECKSLRFTFDFGTSTISHTKLSFGQKRLLSYLYYLSCNTQIGIADELVNGMHHEWIDYCLGSACADRQMFYTSQNPLLLDFLSFENAADVSERFVTCKWTEHDGFIWENLEPRVGEEFYRLYKAGIQHVSDILRTKGWW